MDRRESGESMENSEEDNTLAPAEPQRMQLYIKAGPDGISTGDCPFAHYVRMVLEEKKVHYDLHPSTKETKPAWLVDSYGGSMPALKNGTECYVESEVISQHLDSSVVPVSSLSSYTKEEMDRATGCTDGFFPKVAKYLKHTEDGDARDLMLKADLELALGKLNTHLEGDGRSGPYLVGDGERITLLDCALAPKLYHLSVGLVAFKGNEVRLEDSFPAVRKYADAIFGRRSFQKSSYPEDFIVWGWSNARE